MIAALDVVASVVLGLVVEVVEEGGLLEVVVGVVLLCPDDEVEDVVEAVVLGAVFVLVFDLVVLGGTQICSTGSHTRPTQHGFFLHF